MNPTAHPFLQAVSISKRYGGVQAVRAVDLVINTGEVIGLVGDTDSGKSTLLGLISGLLKPDSGHFYVNGRRARLSPSHRAAQVGIKVVHQDINAVEHMSALAYIFAGQKPDAPGLRRWLGWWDATRLQDRAWVEFERLGFDPPPLDGLLNDLTSPQRKMIAFVHATICRPRLLLLDEPMNALEAYKDEIFRLINALRAQGNAVLLVTQNLDDIFHVSDRIVLLSAGQKIAERRAADTTAEEITRLILGAAEDKLTPAVWALSNYFEVRRQAEQLDQLNRALERRAVQLQTHADVARSVTSLLNRDELLTQIAQIIQQRFGYDHTGIFLLDEAGQMAILRSSASRDAAPAEVTDVRLPVAEESIVGWCARRGQSRLANDVTLDPLFRRDHTRPDTRSELALPLRIGQRVLGVLDLQGDRINTFDEDDVLVLQSLADQLAIAIRNAELYEAAKTARQQADEANRFKSIFLSNMSHELRTPLTAIIGHTQAMLDPGAAFYKTPLPPDYVHDLQTIRKSGEHLLALINDILDLSKIEAGELKLNLAVLDLARILDEAMTTAAVLIQGRAIELHREYNDDLPPVWADSVRAQQIVINLLANAAKFTEQGRITLRANRQADEVIVTVRDTGIGIPRHLRQHIFERFRQGDMTTSKKWAGTGLGLNISRQLVEMQGGRIWVESEVGIGSVFSFTLPAASAAQLASCGGQIVESAAPNTLRSLVFEPDPVAAPSTDVKLVLLVCHDPHTSLALQQALEKAGYAVELTSADERMIEMVDIIQPDLVIVDTTEDPASRILRKLLETLHTKNIPLIAFVESDRLMAFEYQNDPSAHIHVLNKATVTPQVINQVVRDSFDRAGG
jgi:signal transduction histidine kinase/CheY-like chemotaxis protein